MLGLGEPVLSSSWRLRGSGGVGSATRSPAGFQFLGEAGACWDLPSRFLWRSFRFLAAGNFPNTPTPRGGAPKKFEFLHFAKVCVLLGARSLKRLGFVIVPAYPPAGGLCL